MGGVVRDIIIGSGPAGMTAALLLARQGHEVVLVDRDPGPVDGLPWRRVGVMQFHLPHAFRAQCRNVLATRLPDLYEVLLEAGVEGHGELMHARRATFERAMWMHTSRQPGVRRLTGHVERIEMVDGVATGVVVDGTRVDGDLVVDASGRNGRPSAARRPVGMISDAGVAYAARQYQLLPGAEPGPTNGGPGIVHELQGFIVMVFQQDEGTFTVLFVRSKDDDDLAVLRDTAAFEAAAGLLADVATWTDPARSRPIDRVRAGAGIFNQYRGQSTTVRNLLAIGDSVCTTNPMGARGVALGMQSAAVLAEVVAGAAPETWAAALDAWCFANQKVWHDDHIVTDDALLAEWRGQKVDADGPISWMVVAAAARERHPEWMALLSPFLGMFAKPESLDPLRVEVRAMLRDGWRPAPRPGPTRQDLVAAVSQMAAA
jgi:2-polyprenyl-6-methoxyphenol hydroxylase-like FAD-dependent oxidoreductase